MLSHVTLMLFMLCMLFAPCRRRKKTHFTLEQRPIGERKTQSHTFKGCLDRVYVIANSVEAKKTDLWFLSFTKLQLE